MDILQGLYNLPDYSKVILFCPFYLNHKLAQVHPLNYILHNVYVISIFKYIKNLIHIWMITRLQNSKLNLLTCQILISHSMFLYDFYCNFFTRKLNLFSFNYLSKSSSSDYFITTTIEIIDNSSLLSNCLSK